MRKHLINKSIGKGKILSGIYLNKVFQGPYSVYVNLTDHCNLNCLMCSGYSPLLKKKDHRQNKDFLPKEILDKLVNSLDALNVQLVTITGGGEPFLHPYLMDFVRALCKTRKDVTIITNGTMIQDEQLPELLKLDVNLRFSLIAASAEKYVEVHPNQTAKTFLRLKNNLAFIKNTRERIHSRSVISILFVIFKNNFEEIPVMFNMGKEYNVDFVHFMPAIFNQEEMKELFLNDADFKILKDIAVHSKDSLCTDITNVCNDLKINQNFVTNMNKLDLKRSTPCYKGWNFCWILANGDVLPCCNCNTSLGNIKDETLENIWHSKRYSEQRRSMATRRDGIISILGCKCDTCKPEKEEVKISKLLPLLRCRSFIHDGT